MSTNLKRKHEGLANYLQPLGAPGDVRVVGLQPRQPVAPGGAMPGGFRPIPTRTYPFGGHPKAKVLIRSPVTRMTNP